MCDIRRFIRKYAAIAVTLTMPLGSGAFCADLMASEPASADTGEERSADEELAAIVDALNGKGNPEDLYGLTLDMSKVLDQLPEEQRRALLESGIVKGNEIEFTSDENGSYSSEGTQLNSFLDELMDDGITSLDAQAQFGEVTPVTAESAITPVETDSSVTAVTAESGEDNPGFFSDILQDLADEESDDDEDEDNDERIISPLSAQLPGLFTVVRTDEEPDAMTAAGALSVDGSGQLYAFEQPYDIYNDDEDYDDEDDEDDEDDDEDFDDLSDNDEDEQPDADSYDDTAAMTGYGVYSSSKVIEAPSALPATMELVLGGESMPSVDGFVRVFMPALSPTTDDKGSVVTVRPQTEKDFAERDEFGIPRDEEGGIVGSQFVRYVGVDSEGVLKFTADEDGLITYPQDQKLYYNAEDKRFYSDPEGTIPITGIKGFVDLAQLMMDTPSVLSLLDAVDGTAATVDIPGSQIYPKTYIDSSSGKEISESEAASLPEERVEVKDPEDQSWLLWKVTEDDKDYAPSFAKYACGTKDGDILFYTDDNGRIYYDLSGSVLYDGKYLFSFDSDKASGSDNNLITSYSRLGLLVYPGAGETVYFTVDGEAFALSMYDSGEGAKGRYLCRNVTELISEGADKVVSAKKAGKNYGKLLTDPTIFSLMDANGNICYGADDFEWQFLDYGLDYDRLKALMEAGQLPYGVEENIEEEPAAEEQEPQPQETVPEEPEVEEEPEEVDDDAVIDGLTRADFRNDKDWEDYVNSELNEDYEYEDEEDDEDDEEDEDDREYLDGDDGAVIIDMGAPPSMEVYPMQRQ